MNPASRALASCQARRHAVDVGEPEVEDHHLDRVARHELQRLRPAVEPGDLAYSHSRVRTSGKAMSSSSSTTRTRCAMGRSIGVRRPRPRAKAQLPAVAIARPPLRRRRRTGAVARVSRAARGPFAHRHVVHLVHRGRVIHRRREQVAPEPRWRRNRNRGWFRRRR